MKKHALAAVLLGAVSIAAVAVAYAGRPVSEPAQGLVAGGAGASAGLPFDVPEQPAGIPMVLIPPCVADSFIEDGDAVVRWVFTAPAAGYYALSAQPVGASDEISMEVDGVEADGILPGLPTGSVHHALFMRRGESVPVEIWTRHAPGLSLVISSDVQTDAYQASDGSVRSSFRICTAQPFAGGGIFAPPPIRLGSI
ncbi:hypothetical protein WV31_10580 [Magnetospirillum sp. ME-1]|uniref:hypothetical protein n=1 Tax=Magnetospirillum sp. ME-1 TaxID=1639348 RepID=UPI000A179F97|nr:hypothetical protein [Magnetospirillum sp. ME-1]ARJ66073.1 hypothetical protein WV31_10580 [Magnetospirillum sp. ME-1]